MKTYISLTLKIRWWEPYGKFSEGYYALSGNILCTILCVRPNTDGLERGLVLFMSLVGLENCVQLVVTASWSLVKPPVPHVDTFWFILEIFSYNVLKYFVVQQKSKIKRTTTWLILAQQNRITRETTLIIEELNFGNQNQINLPVAVYSGRRQWKFALGNISAKIMRK